MRNRSQIQPRRGALAKGYINEHTDVWGLVAARATQMEMRYTNFRQEYAATPA